MDNNHDFVAVYMDPSFDDYGVLNVLKTLNIEVFEKNLGTNLKPHKKLGSYIIGKGFELWITANFTSPSQPNTNIQGILYINRDTKEVKVVEHAPAWNTVREGFPEIWILLSYYLKCHDNDSHTSYMIDKALIQNSYNSMEHDEYTGDVICCEVKITAPTLAGTQLIKKFTPLNLVLKQLSNEIEKIE